jgi:cyanophycin synthetase
MGNTQDEDMEVVLHIQSLTVEAVKQGGVSILNADDPCIVPLMKRAKGRIILYGRNENTPVMKKHITRGGEAVYAEKGIVFAVKERLKHRLFSIREDESIPAALAAAAAVSALKLDFVVKEHHLLQKLGVINTRSV